MRRTPKSSRNIEEATAPPWIYTAIILVNLLMLIPPVLIARARVQKSRDPRIHLFHDMDNQRNWEEMLVGVQDVK